MIGWKNDFLPPASPTSLSITYDANTRRNQQTILKTMSLSEDFKKNRKI